MYRQWGGDIINMSVIPESKLAREAELEYVFSSSSFPSAPSIAKHPSSPLLSSHTKCNAGQY
jgi:purine nucleoside phosphorylase